MTTLGTLKILLTADTGKFKKDMTEGQKAVSSFKSDIGNMAKGMAGAFTATAIVAGISNIAKETAAYAKNVEDLSRSLGVSTEEASKLIQITDDLEISYEGLQQGAKFALDHGITPNIQGMKDLAKEYQLIEDPAKRAQFAIDHFGKAGLEMQKILEKSPEQIQEMADALEGSALIMDQEGVEAAKNYRLQLDAMNDRAAELELTVGTKLIPKMTDLIVVLTELTSLDAENWFEDGADAAAKFVNSFFFGKRPVDEFNDALKTGMGELRKYDMSLEFLGRTMGEVTKTEKELIAEQKLLKDELSELKDLMSTDLTDSAVNFREKQRELNQEAKSLREEVRKLEGAEWLTDEQRGQLIENKAKLNEIQGQIKANADEHEKATKKIMFDLLTQRAAMDGLTSGELELLTEIAKKWGLVDQATVDATKSADQALVDFANGQGMTETIEQLDTALWLADGWAKKLYDINGKQFTVDVLTNYHYTGNPPNTGSSGGGGGDQSTRPPERGGASGLDMIVPAGYPNDTAPYWATSGERVTITPAGEKVKGSIQIGNVIMQISSPVANGEQLYREFKRRLKEDLRTERLRA